MALSEDDERRVEGQVLAMTRELRDRPNQEKEDRIGVEIAENRCKIGPVATELDQTCGVCGHRSDS